MKQSIDNLIDKDYHYHCKADKLVKAYFRYCSPQFRFETH